RKRRQPQFARTVMTHHYERGGSVIERATVGCGDRASVTENRFHLRDAVRGHAVARTVIGTNHTAIGTGYRGDISFPEAAFACGFCQVLASNRELILRRT